MSLMKSYWMLQNARFTVFNISELLSEIQMSEAKYPQPRLRLNNEKWKADWKSLKHSSSNKNEN